MAWPRAFRCAGRAATKWQLSRQGLQHYTSYSWYFFLAIILHLLDCECLMNTPIEFIRRIGPDPHANGAQTVALNNCPDIFELESGDFAIIGIDITDIAISKLPATAGCGPDERI